MKSLVLKCCVVATLLGASWLPVDSRADRNRAVDLDSPIVLVATDILADSGYRQTVVLAVPRGDGTHFGFVLNRPTETSLGSLFPEDPAAQRVGATVHVGGPVMAGAVFALVRGTGEPSSRGVVQVTPQVYAAFSRKAVDEAIASQSVDTRYFAGFVFWLPGELDDELSAGAWDVRTPDADVILNADSAGLWTRLATQPGWFEPAGRSARFA